MLLFLIKWVNFYHWNLNFVIEPRSSNPCYLKLFFVYLRIWVTGVLQNIQKRVLSVKRKSALKSFNREQLLTNILYMQKTGFYKNNNNYYYCFLRAIFRFLLRMRHIYVASICLDFHWEWMECTEHNLIMRIWTSYHS